MWRAGRRRNPIRARSLEDVMRFERFEFGSLRIDGVTYQHDVVIDRGKIRKRKKKPSKPFRASYGHTPLTSAEDIPWKCRALVVGTGADGGLPILDDVVQEARARHVELVVAPTKRAIEMLIEANDETNAILHITC
jgi:hypothetical protein